MCSNRITNIFRLRQQVLPNKRPFPLRYCANHLLSSSNFSKESKSKFKMTSPLISAQDAISLLHQPNVIFLDGSFKRPDGSDAKEEYIQQRIPGALYFDIDQFSLRDSPSPPMLPTVETFNESASLLGISNDDHIIVYGVPNALSMSRVWWMLKTFQHEKVSFLVGGLNAWKEAGGEVESGEPQPRPRTTYHSPGINNNLLATRDSILNEINTPNNSTVVVDVRYQGGYNAGHIPTAINIPFNNFVQTDDWTKFRSIDEINDLLKSHNIHPGTRVIFSCHSGITASITSCARASLGEPVENTAMYDGSWSEWSLNPDLNPVEVSNE